MKRYLMIIFLFCFIKNIFMLTNDKDENFDIDNFITNQKLIIKYDCMTYCNDEIAACDLSCSVNSGQPSCFEECLLNYDNCISKCPDI